jgi:ligand-binding sensor domain-containing protein/two-component sensor histidine kinase
MKYTFVLLFSVILFFDFQLYAQGEVEFLRKNYTIEQGLPENTVLDIVEDEIGFLWIASPNFLTRFNGDDFKVFRKSFDHFVDDSTVRLGKLYLGGDKLWMIVKGGRLEYLDLKTEEFHPVTHFKDEGGEIVNLQTLFFEQNRIYIGTADKGLFIVDQDFKIISRYNESGKQALSSNKVNYIFKSNDQDLWVLTDRGVNKITWGVVSKYVENLIFTHGISFSNGILELSSLTGGVWRKSPSDNSFQLPFKQDSISQGLLKISRTFYDRRNSTYQWSFWIATIGNGLQVVDGRNSSIVQVKLDHDPKDVYCVYGSKNGKIWVGTRKYGVYSLDPVIPLETRSLPEELDPDRKLSINVAEDQGLLYISQNEEILIYEQDFTFKNSLKSHFLFKDLASNNKKIIPIQGKGRFLVSSTDQGSLIYDPATQNIIPIEGIEVDLFRFQIIPENVFMQEKKDFPGKVIVGNEFGLFELDLNRQLFYQVSDQAVFNLSSIDFHKAGVIFSNGNIAVYDFFQSQLYQKEFLNGVVPLNLDIQAIKYQNDWLWLGTLGNGLFLVNIENGRVVNLNSENGLPNDFIMGLEFADTRTLWCSTSNGFFKLNFIKANGIIGIEEILYLNFRNGISISEFLPDFSYQRQDGKICFGSDRGILCLQGQNDSWDEYQPKILLSQVKVNSQEVASFAGIHYLDDLELKSHENSLEFFFTAISKNVPDNLNYSYRLEGYDKSWIQAGNRRYASYTNLDPGDYTFMVKLTNDNFEGAPVKSMLVTINKAYWQTIWFKLLVLMIILSVFYSYYRLRINHLLKLQLVKEEISADLHDDLGAKLTTIQLLSAINKKRFQNQPEVGNLLLKIEKEIQDSSEALHDLVGNIKMKEDDLEGYFSKLRRYASESLDQSNLSYRIYFSENINQLKISMSKRKDIFLILKELINNIRKHAKASKVNIRIESKQDFLLITVFDNGIGFDPNSLSDRDGMKILKYRVEKYKGTMTLHSSPKDGTKVMIAIPLEKDSIMKNFWSNGLQKVSNLWTFN